VGAAAHHADFTVSLDGMPPAHFSYADLENLARRHDPDLDLEAIQDHLAGVSVFADEDFAEYGLDEPTIAGLRNWVTGWYDNLALRLVADLTDDEVPDDL
jgi:hypothetical protein